MQKKIIRQIGKWISTVLLLVSLLLPLMHTETCLAADYTNAKTFYETIPTIKKGDVAYGNFFLGTMAKLAASSTNLRYQTLGFDITLAGNGASVTFSVALGNSMALYDTEDAEGYQYNLYWVPTLTIIHLATAVDPYATQVIFSAPEIVLSANAIMTTKQGDISKGAIAETGWGTVYESGQVYHLNNPDALNAMQEIFSGHNFDSYRAIPGRIYNNNLSILYSLGEGATVASGLSSVTFSAGDTTVPNALHINGSGVYMENYRMMQQFYVLNPSAISLSKTGYHLDPGQEWVNSSGYTFSSGLAYSPKDVNPNVGESNVGYILYANWKANTYTVTYDANGGIGMVASSKYTYDVEGVLRGNTYTKVGYYLEPGAEWNTKPDGSGKSYGSYEKVYNLTAENEGEITLYANWQPIIVKISNDKQDGTGGTDTFYEKYGVGFFKNGSATSKLSQVTAPARTGYSFIGYYNGFFGNGLQIVDASGKIKVANTFYLADDTIYAGYKANNYKITFDKQGGTGGIDSVTTTYDEVLPFAEAPIKSGYSFKGYYTESNGQGQMYYNEFMASDVIYQTDGNMMLYAYWKDETPPQAYLLASIEDWTNQTITMTANAYDYGTGLSSIKLYQNDVLVTEQNNLNGAANATLTFDNTLEGVVTYKAVVMDVNGNTSEVYKVIKYDSKAPSGSVTSIDVDGNEISFVVEVTDINVQ